MALDIGVLMMMCNCANQVSMWCNFVHCLEVRQLAEGGNVLLVNKKGANL